MTTQVTIFQSPKYKVTIEMEHGARYYQIKRTTDGQAVSFGIDHSLGMLKELSDNALDFWAVEDSWFM